MTDEKIIEALECCASGTGCDTCRRCPFYEDKLCDKDRFALEKHLLDLIRRQQEEIERLKQEATELQLRKEMYRVTVDEVRAEAVREFAEKYKTEVTNRYEDIAYKDLFFGVIDNLVKEMTEKEGGKG